MGWLLDDGLWLLLRLLGTIAEELGFGGLEEPGCQVLYVLGVYVLVIDEG